MLNSVDLAAELIKRNALLDAQIAAPAALAAEKASQAVIVKAPAELIAAEVTAARELRDRQAAAEQARLDALCIAARNITVEPVEVS
jgi:hypothetical protein